MKEHVKLQTSRRILERLGCLLSGLLFLLLGMSVFVSYSFALPQTERSYVGDLTDFPHAATPYVVSNEGGIAYLVRFEEELRAFFIRTPHGHCFYKWVESNNRFEDPCYGSKFDLMGNYIEGPSTRSLDEHPHIIESDGKIFVNFQQVMLGTSAFESPVSQNAYHKIRTPKEDCLSALAKADLLLQSRCIELNKVPNDKEIVPRSETDK